MKSILAHVPFVLASVLFAQAPKVSPKEFLGYELGTAYTPMATVDAYVQALLRASPRLRHTEYGRTAEGRLLQYVVVTSEENHARMDDLRKRIALLADPRMAKEAPDPQVLAKDLPVFVWLSYNVHGNETSCTEAALSVLHRLATATDAETLAWLDQMVVILDPCLNPDGRDRYVQWFNGVVGKRPDPEIQSYEHREPWPGGRFNHYLFDLNRDWAFATQRETRARLPHLVAWTPQVHVDFHEMGHDSSYFFFPAEKPVNVNLPEHTLKWGRRFGEGNARAFDQAGFSYYTAEDFDLFYPGYGDSWPSFQGAIGMTYEQAGHGRAGAVVRRDDGTILTLMDRVRHHVLATYATIATASANRFDLLRDYHEFRRSAIEEGRTGPLRAFLLPPGTDPLALDALAETLLLQGIEVHKTLEAFTAETVKPVLGGPPRDLTFEKGTYVVLLSQPEKRLIKTLLEPRTEIRELYFYDVAAWSLPLAFGVQAYEYGINVPVPLEPIESITRRVGTTGKDDPTVGWLLPYSSRGAMEALVDLLRLEVHVRSARKEFVLSDRTYARGTLLIRRNENGPGLAKVLLDVATTRGVNFVPVDSGFTEKGIDLGSQSFVRVVTPRIALLGGEGTAATSFGAARHLLDEVLDVPHSVFRMKDLPGLNLERITAVVIPEGDVPEGSREVLAKFAASGGVVVALGDAAFALAGGGDGALTSIKLAKDREDGKDAGAAAKEARIKWTTEREDHARKQRQPGSIFLVELDPAHPLSFGYRTEIAAFKAGTQAFDAEGPGLHVGLFVDAEPVSGYVNDRASGRLRGRSFLSVEERGDGAFVLFADDPNFRGAWRGMTRLFVNAVLLLPARHPR